METIHLYDRVTCDYELSPSLKMKYFHSAFSNEALRYYDSQVAPSCSTFEKMQDQFNSVTSQNKAKETTKYLKLD
jgi:hypothetical protein